MFHDCERNFGVLEFLPNAHFNTNIAINNVRAPKNKFATEIYQRYKWRWNLWFCSTGIMFWNCSWTSLVFIDSASGSSGKHCRIFNKNSIYKLTVYSYGSLIFPKTLYPIISSKIVIQNHIQQWLCLPQFRKYNHTWLEYCITGTANLWPSRCFWTPVSILAPDKMANAQEHKYRKLYHASAPSSSTSCSHSGQ